MKYQELLMALPSKRAELHTYGSVRHRGEDYPLVALCSSGKKLLIITTGFHGDEPAGPYSVAARLDAWISRAHIKGVALRIYPCVNPVGFDDGHRYGGDQKQNNYVFQYRLPDGKVTGELPPDSDYTEMVPREGMPETTSLLMVDLAKQLKPRGVLDLHQDGDIKGRNFYAYAYQRDPYLPIMGRCRDHGVPAVGASVSTGGDVTPRKTDEYGFVLNWHDGSVTDWFWHQKVPHVVTLETSAAMPLQSAIEINSTWVLGMIDLVASS